VKPRAIGLFGIGLLLLSSCTQINLSSISSSISSFISQSSPHLLLGKPSNATAFNAKDYLLVRPQYALSYNRDKGSPNWVSWQLNQSWLGSLPRLPFEPDGSLPQGWYQVQPADYTGSGFDRGHLVPAADRNKTTADSQAVFLMTNIFPQSPDNNQGPWENLESYCRELARSGRELYITAGGAGVGGTGTNGTATTLGQGKILVPAVTWKIVVVLERPGLPIDSITERTPIIAVIMPNRQGLKTSNWRTYRTSVDAIEQLTGYDFLSAVAPSVQAVLEARTN